MSNPTLIEIIRADAAWVERSGVTIECDSAYSTVAIGDDIFMQGDEADAFNDEAERLWNETQETTMEECRAHLARQYIESLS